MEMGIGNWRKEERSFENGVLSFELPRIMNRNDRVKIKKIRKRILKLTRST